MSASDDICLTCPQRKWIDFALESQGEEQPANVEQKCGMRSVLLSAETRTNA